MEYPGCERLALQDLHRTVGGFLASGRADLERALCAPDRDLFTQETSWASEDSLAWIDDDELVEVTPETIRLRKRELRAALRPRGPPQRPGAGGCASESILSFSPALG